MNLVKEFHSEGLVGHFSIAKTKTLVNYIYFCPNIKNVVNKFVESGSIYQLTIMNQNVGLCTPTLVPETPWEDESMGTKDVLGMCNYGLHFMIS